MTISHLLSVGTRTATPQSRPLLGAGQVPNSAGGFAWAVDDWTRLDRFLVMGSEKGTYYVSEPTLTREAAEATLRCIEEDGVRVALRAVEISRDGRAAKNDPALFALALVLAHGDAIGKACVADMLPHVARTGTHLLHFVAFVESLRGWGRSARRAVARWYEMQEPKALAYQMLKYKARDGWSHRDVLRLRHVKPDSDSKAALYHWTVKGWDDVGELPHPDEVLRQVWAAERLAKVADAKAAAALIRDHDLPREAIPSEWLKVPEVWAALLEHMPPGALIRNLATMTKVGLVTPLSPAADEVARRLCDAEALKRARIHPIQVLSALKTYAQGHGERSDARWEPVAQVVDALDGAFYASFAAVEPSGTRLLVALDVSGSMRQAVVGLPGLDCITAGAALLLATQAVEPRSVLLAFSDRIPRAGYRMEQYYPGTPAYEGASLLTLSPRMRLDAALAEIGKVPNGGTDCSLPMAYAIEHALDVDAFVIFTDNETWAGSEHPVQALWRYRAAVNPRAKLVIAAMAANAFSVVPPDDAGCLNSAGLDAATPSLISGFVAA